MNANACPFTSLSHSYALSNEELEDIYYRMHRESPIVELADIGYWAVMAFDEVRRVLSDQDSFSPEIALEPLEPVVPEAGKILMQGGVSPRRIMVDNPGENHRRARTIVQQSFTANRLAQLEPTIYEIVDTVIDRFLESGSNDILANMLYELPALVLFKLMGVPDSDVKNIKRWADNRLLFTWGRLSAEKQVNAAKEMVDFWQYCVAHVNKKIEHPGDDLPSALLAAGSEEGSEEGKDLQLGEIIDIMFGMLLAGHETTTNQSANTLATVLQRPPLWQRLINDPGLIPKIVEEGLRFRPSVIAWRRVLTKPATIAGQPLPQGTRLMLFLAAANRDPNVFDDPERFDIDRKKTRPHISFGYGPHFCLGAPLARIELRIILERLGQRLPNLRLIEDQSLEAVETVQFRGPKQLLVEW